MSIILYSTGCPRCNVLKKKLDAKGIQYTVEDNIDKILDKGFSNVPWLVVDGAAPMDFTRANQWVNEQEG